MTNFYAFGCSSTYGHGLSDCYNHETKEPGETYSRYAFPALVSEKLNLNLINRSHCGISNKYILNLFIETDICDKSIVLINWTNTNRFCILYKDREPHHLGRWLARKKQKIATQYYKHIWNEHDSTIELYHYANYVDLLCKIKKCKLFQYGHPFLDTMDIPIWSRIQFPNYDILKTRDNNPSLPLALDNLHPGPGHHKLFAKQIIKDIQNEL